MNDKLRNIIINYLRKKYMGLDVKLSDEYPHCLFFTYNGRVIFDYNKKYNCSFVSPEISSFIDSFFGIPVEQKHSILRIWIDIMTKLSPTSIVEDDIVMKIRWYNL